LFIGIFILFIGFFDLLVSSRRHLQLKIDRGSIEAVLPIRHQATGRSIKWLFFILITRWLALRERVSP